MTPVPKCKQYRSLSQFRPISVLPILCKTVYKFVTDLTLPILSKVDYMFYIFINSTCFLFTDLVFVLAIPHKSLQ